MPFNKRDFIKRIMNEIKNSKDKEDWKDIYHTEIDNEVSTNTNRENHIIINKYAGDIYEAIKLYNDNFGEFEIPETKFQFYAQLAFVSIYYKFYENIEKLVDKLANLK